MKTKLKLLIPMIALTLAAFYTAPKSALACSGDDCGCGVAAQECRAACAPGDTPCFRACTHESIQCAIWCCAD